MLLIRWGELSITFHDGVVNVIKSRVAKQPASRLLKVWNLNYIGSGLVEAHGQIAKYSNIFVNEPIPDLHPMGSDNSPCTTVVKCLLLAALEGR